MIVRESWYILPTVLSVVGVALAIDAFRRWQDAGWHQAFVGAVIGSFVSLLGAWLLAERRTITIDASLKRIEWVRTGPLGSRHTATMTFEDVDGAIVDTLTGSDTIATYRVAVVTKDGRRLPITKSYSAERGPAERIAQFITSRAQSARVQRPGSG